MHSFTFYVHRITSLVAMLSMNEAGPLLLPHYSYYFISRNWFNADCNLISNIWIFYLSATSNIVGYGCLHVPCCWWHIPLFFFPCSKCRLYLKLCFLSAKLILFCTSHIIFTIVPCYVHLMCSLKLLYDVVWYDAIIFSINCSSFLSRFSSDRLNDIPVSK